MKKMEIVIGKIESVSVAKMVVRIAAAAMILLGLVRAFDGNFISLGVTVPLALFMAYFNARGAALLLFFWMLIDTFWTVMLTLNLFHQGRSLRLYLPVFGLIVLWFLYRAIRATIFIKAEDEPGVDVESIQDVFE